MNSAIIDSTWLTILPYDLKEYIWSFNYIWAINTIIYSIQKHIQKEKQKKINAISEIISITNKNSDLGIYHKNYHIHYGGNLYSKNDVFKLMISCKCCSRHQKYRPNNFGPWQETRFNWNFSRLLGGCSCSCTCTCRHMARFICRATYGVHHNINN